MKNERNDTRLTQETSDANPTSDTNANTATLTAPANSQAPRSQTALSTRGANGAANGEAISGAIDRLFSPQTFSPRAFLSNPFEAMRRIQHDMDRVFESLASSRYENGRYEGNRYENAENRPANWSNANWNWAPRIEAFERETQLVVRAELPGLKREDVKVSVDDGVLTLSGERKSQNRTDENGFYHSEMSYGRFQRAFRLPETAEIENISAKFEDGILEIAIPNAAPPRKTHEVTIQ